MRRWKSAPGHTWKTSPRCLIILFSLSIMYNRLRRGFFNITGSVLHYYSRLVSKQTRRGTAAAVDHSHLLLLERFVLSVGIGSRYIRRSIGLPFNHFGLPRGKEGRKYLPRGALQCNRESLWQQETPNNKSIQLNPQFFIYHTGIECNHDISLALSVDDALDASEQ